MDHQGQNEGSLSKRNRRLLIAFSLGIAASVVALAVGQLIKPDAQNEAVVLDDPFAKHTWHASKDTWPGTLTFDSELKQVELAPMGADPFTASYSYQISPSLNAESSALHGTLRMENEIGQVSESSFVMEDEDSLILTYVSGQRQEHYIRLSEADVEGQKEKIQTLIESGAFNEVPLPAP